MAINWHPTCFCDVTAKSDTTSHCLWYSRRDWKQEPQEWRTVRYSYTSCLLFTRGGSMLPQSHFGRHIIKQLEAERSLVHCSKSKLPQWLIQFEKKKLDCYNQFISFRAKQPTPENFRVGFWCFSDRAQVEKVLSQTVHRMATYRCDDTRCCVI